MPTPSDTAAEKDPFPENRRRSLTIAIADFCNKTAKGGHGTEVDRFLTRGVQRIVLAGNRSSHGVLQAVFDDR